MNAWSTPDGSPAPRSSWRAPLLVAVTALLVWKFALPGSESLLDPHTPPRAVVPRGELGAEEQATIALNERARVSVVFIQTRVGDSDRLSLNASEPIGGSGSGFLWDRDGHVITNYHVIHVGAELEPARSVIVTLSDHRSLPAQIVGYEVEKDIAVLKIDADEATLYPIDVGSSDELRVGQRVYAIGCPFGLDQTLSDGLIGGLGREIPARFVEEGRGQHPITDLIQTNAAINPGNSGGPLLDSAGRLIGMTTAIMSRSGEFAGIGFAIPVDTINRIVTDILRYGQARRPGLGVLIMSDLRSLEYRVGGVLPVKGVVVENVVPGLSGEKAGLRDSYWTEDRTFVADVITAIDQQPVSGSIDLYRALDRHEIGDTVKLTIDRAGKVLELSVELQDLRTGAVGSLRPTGGQVPVRSDDPPTPRTKRPNRDRRGS